MKTFQEFLEEGKKQEVQKIIQRVTKEVEKQVKKNPPHRTPVLNIGKPVPGTTATSAEIEAMMRMNRDYVRTLKRNQNS